MTGYTSISSHVRRDINNERAACFHAATLSVIQNMHAASLAALAWWTDGCSPRHRMQHRQAVGLDMDVSAIRRLYMLKLLVNRAQSRRRVFRGGKRSV